MLWPIDSWVHAFQRIDRIFIDSDLFSIVYIIFSLAANYFAKVLRLALTCIFNFIMFATLNSENTLINEFINQ